MRTKFIYWRFKDKIYYPTRQFIKNIWKFRRELSNFYDWNYDLGLFRRTLELNRECIQNGYEVKHSRDKKVVMIDRAIIILRHFEHEDFIELAEIELGYKYEYGDFNFEPIEDEPGLSRLLDGLSEEATERNTILRDKAREIQNNMWKELWSIIQGQDYDKFKPNDKMGWDEQFDGSGILGWWD